jgi:hypothetical protein
MSKPFPKYLKALRVKRHNIQDPAVMRLMHLIWIAIYLNPTNLRWLTEDSEDV